MNYTLVVLTLNEIDGMKAIMPRIKREWFEQILVVDGGSTDGTIEYLNRLNDNTINIKKASIIMSKYSTKLSNELGYESANK